MKDIYRDDPAMSPRKRFVTQDNPSSKLSEIIASAEAMEDGQSEFASALMEEMTKEYASPGPMDYMSQGRVDQTGQTNRVDNDNDGRNTPITTAHEFSHQRQSSSTIPDIVSIVSHELLSPLTLIKGYTATLLQFSEAITEEQRGKYLQGIENATNRLIRLLENFRDVSRLEADNSNLALQSISLPKLLRKTITEIQRQTTKHVIKLRHSRPLPSANVDRQKIEQLMVNLILNAVKYSPQGGDIEITVRLATEREIPNDLLGLPLAKLPCLIVTVADKGIGIPEGDLSRVFERFYRVDNRLTRSTSGAGLGLYICKIIVEAHRGHIWAMSDFGKGSTFGFSLPVD